MKKRLFGSAFFVCSLSLAVVLALCAPAGATLFTSKAAYTGDWSEGTTWTNGTAPSDGDDAQITNAGSVVILSIASSNLNSLILGKTLTFTNWNTSLTATNVTILSGGLMTLPMPFTTNQMSNNVYVICSNMFIASGGSVNVNGRGWACGLSNGNGYGPGGGVGAANYSAGGGYGGRGGRSGLLQSNSRGGFTYGSAQNPEEPGSGGGSPSTAATTYSSGGGAVRIQASGTVTVNGTITANGGDAPTSPSVVGGGGSGGGIWISCNWFAGTSGIVRAIGGSQANWPGGAGGGGRISVEFDPASQAAAPKPTVQFLTSQGPVDYAPQTLYPQSAELGTLYFTDKSILDENWIPHVGQWKLPGASSVAFNNLVITNGSIRFPGEGFQLTVTNNLTVVGSSAVLDIGGDSYSTNRYGWQSSYYYFYVGLTSGPVLNIGGNLVVTNGAKMYLYSGLTNAAGAAYGSTVSVTGDVVIAGSSAALYTMSHPTNGASTLFTMANLVVGSGGTLSADARGFMSGNPNQNGYGPGAGRPGGYSGGGGHGGRGGECLNGVLGGPAYGSIINPALAGSGGGSGADIGGAGGGLLMIVATNAITVNGTIRADGMDGLLGVAGSYVGGAGSGGAINMSCRTISGSNGVVRARGGNNNATVPTITAGGAGGRIAVSYNSSAQSLLPRPSIQFDVSPGSFATCGFASDGTINRAETEPGTIYLPDTSLLNETLMNHRGQLVVGSLPSGWSVGSLLVTNGWLRFPADSFQLNVTNNVVINGSSARLDIGGNLNLTNWNANVANIPYSEMTNPPSLICGGNLVLTNGGSLYIYSSWTNATYPSYGALVSVDGDMIVVSNSTVYPYSHPTNGGSALFRVGNLTIYTNASFNADGRGFGNNANYTNGYGPGFGRGRAGVSYASGAGYGGVGGQSHPSYYNAGGGAYGSAQAPLHPGSSGGGGAQTLNFGGGLGGGLVRVEAQNTVTVNGTITANGTRVRPYYYDSDGRYGGGGSGGGVYIRCKKFAGAANAVIRANGGARGTASYSGAGAGGRIAIWRLPYRHTYQGSYSVTNGTPGYTNDATTGTVMLVDMHEAGTIFSVQ